MRPQKNQQRRTSSFSQQSRRSSTSGTIQSRKPTAHSSHLPRTSPQVSAARTQKYSPLPRLPTTRTSWEPLATWYDGWVGKDGSEHHQKLAVPAVMELLNVQKGEQILDIGCGQGVLVPHITKIGGIYTGIDASRTLIQLAQKRHGKNGCFVMGDARQLLRHFAIKTSVGVGTETQSPLFDQAVFLLSIQDMDPLSEIMNQVAQVLKTHSSIVILMTHPCFRIPRQSGWGYDEGRKLFYRRVDHYMTPLSVPLKAYSGHKKGVSLSFHRPLSAYIEALGTQGFAVDACKEITTYKREQTHSPEAKAMNRAFEEIPIFLGLRARRTMST